MKKFFQWYFKTSLILRIITCFAVGSVIGYTFNKTGSPVGQAMIPYISPFGTVFVHMLKMIVIPVIFFSLIAGAASLPINKFGRVGVKTLGWYLFCSLLAAVVGTSLALLINPGSGAQLSEWQQMAGDLGERAKAVAGKAETEPVLHQLLLNLFKNPFEALATGNFLPIIVFSIMFGLAIRICIEAGGNQQRIGRLEMLINFIKACQDAMFKLVDWILEYSPIGVLALTIMNFGEHGSKIVGPYVSVTLGVVLGIATMVFVVYPIILWLVTRHNPFRILLRIKEAMIMAFVTRSSAATLPVSMKTAEEELKIHNELASFSLPLGATINMDGVCVHLPMFAVLAANMFGMQLTATTLLILVITTVLSSIGAGGVPGGSLFLLFIILETMGLGSEHVEVIVTLAVGINPILDMFETMNNITGDLVCTYAVAHNEGLVDSEPSG